VVFVAFLQVWATEVIDLNFTPAIDRAAFAVGYPLYQSIAGSIIIGYLLSRQDIPSCFLFKNKKKKFRGTKKKTKEKKRKEKKRKGKTHQQLITNEPDGRVAGMVHEVGGIIF